MNWKRLLLVVHFILLGLALISFSTKLIWGVGVRWEIDAMQRIIVSLTGLALLIKYARPFRLSTLYFSLYGLIVLVSLTWLFVRGIFWSIMISFVFIIFTPNPILNSSYQYGSFSVYDNATGLLSACCPYKVVKIKYLLFEYAIGEFSTEGVSELRNLRVLQNSDSVRLTYSFDEFDSQKQDYVEKDTAILFPLYQTNNQ